MATQTVSWTTNQIGCIAVTQTSNQSDTDVAAINQSIMDDQSVLLSAPMLGPGGVSLQPGTLVTGQTTSGSATLSTINLTSGPPLTSVQVGYQVLGPGIAPGTVIAPGGVGTTSITLSANATSSQTSSYVLVPADWTGEYQKNGWLTIPNRGQLQVLTGDVVMVTPMGNPILIPADEFMPGSNSPFTRI